MSFKLEYDFLLTGHYMTSEEDTTYIMQQAFLQQENREINYKSIFL